MGTPPFAADILGELLKNGYNIISVFTQPDKKIGPKAGNFFFAGEKNGP